jgi:TonB family protein
LTATLKTRLIVAGTGNLPKPPVLNPACQVALDGERTERGFPDVGSGLNAPFKYLFLPLSGGTDVPDVVNTSGDSSRKSRGNMRRALFRCSARVVAPLMMTLLTGACSHSTANLEPDSSPRAKIPKTTTFKDPKYSAFFEQVKQSVGKQWDPGAQLRARDPSLKIYGGKDRFTIVNVTLDENGMVKEILVDKSSGVDFLDTEAIESFQRAQPFPNPPPGLLSVNSTVRFQFGFFLELGSRAKR